jgi:hypothetical protein
VSTITLRVEFSLFPDNTVLGPSFTLGGFEFTDAANPPSFVNDSGGTKGLQFGKQGVRVRLPIETDVVDIRAAAFATEIKIHGKNAFGTTVAVETIPGDNTPRSVRLIHPGLATVDFEGGNNEGTIIEMRYDVDCGTEKDGEAERA